MIPIYLDYAATTPLDSSVLDAMLPFLREHHGNPSSLHAAGQRARRAVEEAREKVAAALGAAPKEIIFTSGATESINQALKAVAAEVADCHIITSALEHAATLETCRHLQTLGVEVTYLSPTSSGEILPQQVADALQTNTRLVALMRVNNETGVRTDIAAVSELAKAANIKLFCDAVQAFGFEEVNVNALGVDMLSVSGHKIYGPKGVGVLYVRAGLEPAPLIVGGQQERGLRAGTYNTPAIVGMGAAAELAVENVKNVDQLAALRDGFEIQLKQLEGVSINASDAPRGPKHTSVRVAGVDGETLLHLLDTLGIQASAGSACAAGSLEPSHVLLAMGLSPQDAKASVRFTLGKDVDAEMLSEAARRFATAVERCRVFAT